MGRRTAERAVLARLSAAGVKDCPGFLAGFEDSRRSFDSLSTPARNCGVPGIPVRSLRMTGVWVVRAGSRSFDCVSRYCRLIALRMTEGGRCSGCAAYRIQEEPRSALARRAHPSRPRVLEREAPRCAKDGAPGLFSPSFRHESAKDRRPTAALWLCRRKQKRRQAFYTHPPREHPNQPETGSLGTPRDRREWGTRVHGRTMRRGQAKLTFLLR